MILQILRIIIILQQNATQHGGEHNKNYEGMIAAESLSNKTKKRRQAIGAEKYAAAAGDETKELFAWKRESSNIGFSY